MSLYCIFLDHFLINIRRQQWLQKTKFKLFRQHLPGFGIQRGHELDSEPSFVIPCGP